MESKGFISKVYYLVALLVLSQCAAGSAGQVGTVAGETAGTSAVAGGSSNSGNSLTETGSPVDIPVTIAKVIKPVDPRFINALPTDDSILLSGTAEPDARIQLYKNSDYLGEISSDSSGDFDTAFSLAEVGLEEPISMIVTDGSNSSTPITVRAFGDSTFTVSVTEASSVFNVDDYTILNRSIAYAPSCEGIAYNAHNQVENNYAILCANLTNATVVPLIEGMSAPLENMQFASDGSFVVGLNASNQIVHINLETEVSTMISDATVTGQYPEILLSPDNHYVLTTSNLGGSYDFAVLEPTSFVPAAAQSDSVIINEVRGTADKVDMVDCTWMHSDKIQCSFYWDDPSLGVWDHHYGLLRLDLASTFASPASHVEINPEATVYFNKNLILRNRTHPTTEDLTVFEGCASSDPLDNQPAWATNCLDRHPFSLGTSDLGEHSFEYFTSGVNHANSSWSLDGDYVMFEATFDGGLHPGKPKIVILNNFFPLPLNKPIRPGTFGYVAYGTRVISADPNHPELLAYLCEDSDSNYQLCVANVDKVNPEAY